MGVGVEVYLIPLFLCAPLCQNSKKTDLTNKNLQQQGQATGINLTPFLALVFNVDVPSKQPRFLVEVCDFDK